jgi:hypothetical protein
VLFSSSVTLETATKEEEDETWLALELTYTEELASVALAETELKAEEETVSSIALAEDEKAWLVLTGRDGEALTATLLLELMSWVPHFPKPAWQPVWQ